MVSCTENHPLCQCNVYRNKSSAEKLKVVQKYNYCLNCLQKVHSVESCTIYWMCTCRLSDYNAKHSTALKTQVLVQFLFLSCFLADFYAQCGKLGVFGVEEFIFGRKCGDG